MHGGEDIIATLSGRVSELSKRVALLQAELESATKRVAIYEEHDSTIQEALSGALRAAYQIRERAETTAEQILDQAREERRMLLKEIERLREERDSVQDEIATQRRSGIGPVASRSLTSDSVASELRSVASEALKGLFQEIVDDLRTRTPAPSAPPAPAAARPLEPAPAPRAPEPIRREEPRMEPAARAAETPRAAGAMHAPPTREVEPAAAATYEAMARVKRASLTEEEEVAAQPAAEAAAPAQAAASAPAPAATPPPAAQAAQMTEPVMRPVAVPTPPIEVVRPRVEVEEIAPPRVEAASPTSDIQLVLSPIASFPRLVEIERHIQALPVVRTLYVRDFRSGTATLAVTLRSAMTPEEFAGMLAGIAQPHLRLMSGSRNVLELRVEGEASIA